MRWKINQKNLFVNNSGSSAIEFAIIAPVFLLIVMGMIAYGIYLGAAHSIQQIGANAARASLAGMDTEERTLLATTYIANNAQAYDLIDPTLIIVEVSPMPTDENSFKVSISYDAASLPIWNLHVPLPLPSKIITSASVIRNGGV